MNTNKMLLVTFSNGVQCSGVLSVNFAKNHVSQLFPDKDISVNIYEVFEADNSRTLLWKRVDGAWENTSVE